MIGRRDLLLGAGAVLLPWSVPACQRQTETPLAHLYGQQWVHGVYQLYAQGYADIQQRATRQSNDAYKVLVQKGIVALDNLQRREVPFYIHVDDAGESFSVFGNRYIYSRNPTVNPEGTVTLAIIDLDNCRFTTIVNDSAGGLPSSTSGTLYGLSFNGFSETDSL